MTEFACIVRRRVGLMGESGDKTEGRDTSGMMRVDVEEGIKRADRMGEPLDKSRLTDETGGD